MNSSKTKSKVNKTDYEVQLFSKIKSEDQHSSQTNSEIQLSSKTNSESKRREPIILKKWGPETTHHLVEQYYMHPCLWDPTHMNYKNVRLRYEALNSIADAMLSFGGIDEMDAEAVKGKIRVIRNTYTNELRKRESLKNTMNYKTNLCWFELADSFLRNVVKVPLSRIDGGDDESSRTSSQDGVKVEILHPLEDNAEIMPQLELQSNSPVYEYDQVYSYPGSYYDGQPAKKARLTEDEFDLFGRSIAEQLRQLPAVEALELQAQIQKLVSEKRISVIKKEDGL